MTTGPEKFLPSPSPLSRVYWQACHEHRLLIQHCPECDHFQFYPRRICTRCMCTDPEWVQASGYGSVETWTVVRHPVSRAYEADTPYVIALVRLQEGPVMMSQLGNCDPDQVVSGLAVKVAFEAWSEEFTVPVFVPAKDGS